MVCERNFCNYNNYYSDQAGGSLDISYYRGAPYQRGYGNFSTFTKRYGVPVLKYLLKQGIFAGRDILNDITTGKKFSQATKRALIKRAGSSFKDLGERIEQSGSGMRKKPRIHLIRRKRKSKNSQKSKSKVNRRKKCKTTKRRKNKSNLSKKFDIFK